MHRSANTYALFSLAFFAGTGYIGITEAMVPGGTGAKQMAPSFEDMNITTSGGDMNIRKRRLHTFTITWNEKSERFCVLDDTKNGALVGAGFATIADVERFYGRQDQRRVAW